MDRQSKTATAYETGSEKGKSGFVNTSEVIAKSDQINIAQHNCIIEYLTIILAKVNKLEDRIEQLGKIETSATGISDIINKIDKLSISPPQLKKDLNPFIFQIVHDPRKEDKNKEKI